MKSSLRLAHLLLFAGAVFTDASALTCPSFPTQISGDTRTKVDVEVGKLAKVAAGAIRIETAKVTRDLFQAVPQGERLYMEQMLSAMFCSHLRDNKSMSDAEKSSALRNWAVDVRKGLADAKSSTPVPKENARPRRQTGPLDQLGFNPSAYKSPPDITLDSFESTATSLFNAEGVARSYRLDYSFPASPPKKLFAGLQLPLIREVRDLTQFSRIEMSFTATNGAKFSLMSSDARGHQDDFLVTGTGSPQKLVIPLDRYIQNGDRRSMLNMYIISSTDLQSVPGRYSVELTSFRFLRD